MIELRATSSHLYPGALCHVEGETQSSGKSVVAFADGARASAELQGDRLEVAAYETTAGTSIGARVWRIEALGKGDIRIVSRLI